MITQHDPAHIHVHTSHADTTGCQWVGGIRKAKLSNSTRTEREMGKQNKLRQRIRITSIRLGWDESVVREGGRKAWRNNC